MMPRLRKLALSALPPALALAMQAGAADAPVKPADGAPPPPPLPVPLASVMTGPATAGPFEHWIFFDALTMATNCEKYVRIGSGANEAWANIQNIALCLAPCVTLCGCRAGRADSAALDQPPGTFVWRAYGYVDSEPASIWDTAHQRFLSWGGHFLDVWHEQNDDVWAFDVRHPEWKLMPQVNAPIAHCSANQLSFDAARGTMLTFGNDGDQSHGWIPACIQGLNRSIPMTYDYGTNQWNVRRPYPSPPGGIRQHKGFVYHPAFDVHVLYGGHFNDLHRQKGQDAAPATWIYDPHANQWSELPTDNQPEQSPGPQSGCLLVVHPDTDEVLLRGREPSRDGGRTGGRSTLFALSLTEKKWRKIEARNAPPDLFQASFFFDPHADAFVLMGAEPTSSPAKLQIWKLPRDLSAWERVPVPTTGASALDLPGGTGEHARPFDFLSFTAAYSPELNLYLISAGNFGPYNFSTWTYRLAATRRLEPTAIADARLALTNSGERTFAELRWSALDENPREKALGPRTYAIWRAEADNPWPADFQAIGQTTATSYRDPTITKGRRYIYRITTERREDSRHGGAHGVLKSAPLRSDLAAPRAPVVSVLSHGQVEVALPPPAPSSAGFLVERAKVRTSRFVGFYGKVLTEMLFSDFAPIRRTGTRTMLDDLDLSRIEDDWRFEQPPNPICVCYGPTVAPPPKWNPLAVYAYRVREVDALGNASGPSGWVLTLPAAPSTPLVIAPPPEDPKNGIVGLRWPPEKSEGSGPQQKNIAGYNVYRQLTKLAGPDGSAPWTVPYHDDPKRWHKVNDRLLTSCTFEDGDIPGGNSMRRYYVTAVDRFGQEGGPSSGAWAYRPENYDDPPPLKQTPRALIPDLPEAAMVDGDLSDAAWEKAAVLSLRFMDGRRESSFKAPQQKTEVRMFTSGGWLYVATTCHEDRMNELAAHADWKHDSEFLWKDDTIEFSFVLDPEGTGAMHHLMVSASGVTRDCLGSGGNLDPKAWNPAMETKVVRQADRWCVEFNIPLAEFRTDLRGLSARACPSLIRFNVVRNRPQSAHRDLEETGWAPTFYSRPGVRTRMGFLGFQTSGAPAGISK